MSGFLPREFVKKERMRVFRHDGVVVKYESSDARLHVGPIDLGLHQRGELLAGRALKIPELQDRDRRVGVPPLDARRHGHDPDVRGALPGAVGLDLDRWRGSER